jgi:hypothetical protein
MNIKRLLGGLIVAGSLASTAYAGILPYLPKVSYSPGDLVIRILDKDKELRARRLCLGKYRNVGKCKDGVSSDPEVKMEAAEMDDAEREALEREVEQAEEAGNSETAETREGPTEVDTEIKTEPNPAKQPEQSLE